MFRAVCLSLLLILLAPSAIARDVVVFAASSLKTALDEVLLGQNVRVSYGGSGALARQILLGAPADIFISANPLWMDQIEVVQRVDLLSNSIVIVSRDETVLGDDGRIAMGLLNSVPVGIYGRAYLEAEGLWGKVRDRVIETDSARAALAFAARGEVPYAVVYATDAQAVPSLNVVATLDPRAELPILYPMALLDHGDKNAQDVFDLLQGSRAREVFKHHGFGAP